MVVTETGQGTHAAQSAVTYANILFPSFEVQILVGIGGSRRSDAPIGSVVASDHVYMPYSAKYSDGKRRSRPRTFQVDQRLIGIAKKVRRDKLWPGRIRDPDDGKLPAIDVYPTALPPLGLVAPVASVEAVLADPESELEVLIADGYDDTCVVEMEGYGAVYAASHENVPSIVVRGVSDMTKDKSSETDAELQPVVACHAAAFAFEMLSHWAQAYPTDTIVALGATPGPGVPNIEHPSVPGSTDHEFGGPAEAIIEPEPIKSGEVETTLAAKPSPDLVINIDEESPVDLEARVSAIEALLREIVNSDQVTVTDAECGSLRLFIADPLSELRETGVTELRAAFAERHQPELLGMVDVTEYEGLGAVRAQLGSASAELLAWPNTLPDGEIIDRPELAQLIEKIDGCSASTTAVLGSPGAGKSALLTTLAKRYVEIGWPVLAIKGDLLYAGISTEEDLQKHLALDAPPSDLVQRLAKFQRVLLILDQLDALAGYLDLRTARLSILLSLVRRLGGIDNVHIVLSSRTFEFEHDVRLRAVSTRRARPEIGIVAIADGAADNWTFLETLSPETEVIDFWHACEHLQTASDHAVAPGWFEKYREILRHDPRGVAKVIRALRHLRDAAAAPDRAETERELAFFRKHRHRMRYHALKEEGIAIGSGVVEAANKTLVTQRMKRSGMRWRIVGGQAVLTFRALIKSGRFERAWKALISATDTPANDNISPRAAAMAIAA